jgi:uncharacterized membrane protein YgdD (TMEM256/DUF423 family)
MAGWQRLCVVGAGVSGALAMVLAAMAAHGLEPQAAGWIERGSRYQLLHAAVILAVGIGQGQGKCLKAAAALFAAGTLLFSGSLYAMALFGWPLNALVPFGGTSFILGWLLIAVAGWRSAPPP